jgi:Ca-activated chloride channel homolog
MRRQAGSTRVLWAAVALVFALEGCLLRDRFTRNDGAPRVTQLDTQLEPKALSGSAANEPEVYAPRPFADSEFEHHGVNPTLDTDEERFSVFAADVDTASYSLTRSYLGSGVLIPEAAVRVEEFVNSFDYDHPAPVKRAPIRLTAAAFPSPSRPGYHVLQLGLRARDPAPGSRKPLHLVLVVDGSGSMALGGRLHLVRRSLGFLLRQLDERDRVGLVVFQARGRVLLELTPATEREKILQALDDIRPDGSTNVQSGIALGYALLARAPERGVTERVVLCSDGVANTGRLTEADAIFGSIRTQAQRGIAISTVGVGMGNYNDVLLERLAQVGGGSYAYIDDAREAERLFVDRLSSTLEVLARDVKLQVEFDPRVVSRWRLLGYENRRLRSEEFDDDGAAGGAIGPGHSVTALYEIKLHGPVDALGWFRARYQGPEGRGSKQEALRLDASIVSADYAAAPGTARLAHVVAAFAEKLRGSYWVRKLGYDELLALHAQLPDALRERESVRELAELIEDARALDDRGDRFAADREDGGVDWDALPVLK